MQHQTLAEILRTFAALLPNLPPDLAEQVADIVLVLRSLSALGEHVLTRDLESALDRLARAMAVAGRGTVAEAVTQAADTLQRSVGTIRSRATRGG